MSDHRPADLPYLDEHAITVAAPREVVWPALEDYAASIGFGARNPLARVLGTQPRAGFGVAERVPPRSLTLSGRHHFSQYVLIFDLADIGDGQTRLSARSYALFPGPHGRVYRTLVIGTRLHVVATTAILRSVRRRSRQAVR